MKVRRAARNALRSMVKGLPLKASRAARLLVTCHLGFHRYFYETFQLPEPYGRTAFYRCKWCGHRGPWRHL